MGFQLCGLMRFGAVWCGLNQFDSERRMEDGGRRTEVRGQRTEVRGQRSEDGEKAEMRLVTLAATWVRGRGYPWGKLAGTPLQRCKHWGF